MTLAILVAYLALHSLFIWARVAVFRIDGATPPRVRLTELTVSIAIVVGVILMLGRGAGNFAQDGVAWLLATSSGALFLWGLRSIRRRQLTAAFSADVPGELIIAGPFRYIRNPFYLSYLLAHAVPVAASRSAWAVPSLVLLAWIYVRAAVFEERKFLASPVAEEWRVYRRRTGRFLPRLRVWTGD